jgi:hypothetical protein
MAALTVPEDLEKRWLHQHRGTWPTATKHGTYPAFTVTRALLCTLDTPDRGTEPLSKDLQRLSALQLGLQVQAKPSGSDQDSHPAALTAYESEAAFVACSFWYLPRSGCTTTTTQTA